MTDAFSFINRGVRTKAGTYDDFDRPLVALGDAFDSLLAGRPTFFSWRGLLTGQPPDPRELRRFMNNRSLQVSLPSGPQAPLPADAKSAVRPLAGSVVPLTVTPGNASEELLGGAGTPAVRGDAIATQVLVKGEPVPAPRGRADDFAWQGDANAAQPTAAMPAMVPVMAEGMLMRAIAALISSAASPSDFPGFRLNEMVEATNSP